MTATIRKKSVVNCLLPSALKPRPLRPPNIRIDHSLSGKTLSNDLMEEEDVLAMKLMNRVATKQQKQMRKNLMSSSSSNQEL